MSYRIKPGDAVYPRYPGPFACYGEVLTIDRFEGTVVVEWEDGETTNEDPDILRRVKIAV